MCRHDTLEVLFKPYRSKVVGRIMATVRVVCRACREPMQFSVSDFQLTQDLRALQVGLVPGGHAAPSEGVTIIKPVRSFHGGTA